MSKNKIDRKLETVVTPQAPVIEDSAFLTAILDSNAIDIKHALDQKTLGFDGDNMKNTTSICNDLVQAFNGFTAKTYDTKMRALFLENNLFFRAKKVNGKSVVRDDAVTLERTAQSIISTIKRYITQKDQLITDDTKWNHIKEFLKPTPKKLSDVRKVQNARIKDMSDKLLTDVLALWDKDQKEKALETQNALILKKMIKGKKVEKAVIHKSTPVRNKILNKAFG